MKYISIEQSLALLKSGDSVMVAVISEAQALLSQVHTISKRGIKDVNITGCIPMQPYPFFTDEAYKENFITDLLFYTAAARKAGKKTRLSFVPNHLHRAYSTRGNYKHYDFFWGTCSPVDPHGFVSLSLSNIYDKRLLLDADTVVLEENPNYPRTFGDLEVHISEIDYLVKTDHKAPTIASQEPGEIDRQIGAHIASEIHDGDCLQLGIGAVPNAVGSLLKDKNDLGIHTEMITSTMGELAKAGNINGRYKTLHNRKIIGTFALGDQALYDYIHENPSLFLLDGGYVNDPAVIAQNDNMVSINTGVEIDLSGQVCSESIGVQQISGTGGQSDTAVGAGKSKNGRSFIAMHSTMEIKNLDGTRKVISKINPMLKRGAAVSLSRNDVDRVVTEYGIAKLRGASIRERALALIRIAHPDFRESLTLEAKELGLI